jgi:hypothetical protein
MSVHGHTTDAGLLLTGMVTGFFGLQLTEIDVLMGIILKGVSIISFTIVAIVNLKKLFPKK